MIKSENVISFLIVFVAFLADWYGLR